MITEMVAGRHQFYITNYFNGIFSAGENSNGMRYSVYCTEQIAYARSPLLEGQNQIFPWLAGLHLNNVNKTICSCWNVKPLEQRHIDPFYSNVPLLLGSGDTDPYCRPIYNDLLHHYLPNSQRMLFTDKTHAPLLSTRDGDELIEKFLNNPWQKLQADGKRMIDY